MPDLALRVAAIAISALLGLSAAAQASAPTRVTVASHIVVRSLSQTRVAKALPVHAGGSIRVRAARPVRELQITWAAANGATIKTRGTSASDGRSWTLNVPDGQLISGVITLRADRGTVRYRLRVRLHAHPRVQTLESGRLFAVWAFHPKGLLDMTRRSAAAVEAVVVRIRRGPALDPEHQFPPTQRITFRVKQRWFGRVPSTFTLFKTGDNAQWAEGDPPYAVGERHVLFLQHARLKDGSWNFIAPDGRLRIRRGLLSPTYTGPVAEQLKALTVEEARSASRRLRR